LLNALVGQIIKKEVEKNYYKREICYIKVENIFFFLLVQKEMEKQ
jgi:hypothetical protein